MEHYTVERQYFVHPLEMKNIFELLRVGQAGGKMQIVQVSEGFELNCSGDIEVQLYFCCLTTLTQGSTRCVQDYTSFFNVQDVWKIVLVSSIGPILPNLPCFKRESFQLI